MDKLPQWMDDEDRRARDAVNRIVAEYPAVLCHATVVAEVLNRYRNELRGALTDLRKSRAGGQA